MILQLQQPPLRPSLVNPQWDSLNSQGSRLGFLDQVSMCSFMNLLYRQHAMQKIKDIHESTLKWVNLNMIKLASIQTLLYREFLDKNYCMSLHAIASMIIQPSLLRAISYSIWINLINENKCTKDLCAYKVCLYML